MRYSVLIRNNETGEERLYPLCKEVPWGDGSYYWWTEGNMSCDCNRHMSFLRAGGPGPVDDPHWNDVDRDCGDGAYSVPYAVLEDGTRIALDESLSQ